MNAIATLSAAEADLLAQAEATIERGIKTFVEVGQALASVRDNRLYRSTHGTFEEYAERRWNLSRTRAYELMSAASIVSAIADTELPTPANEGQARALARVPEADRAEVWRETLDRTDGRPTAAAVAATWQERQQPEPGEVGTTDAIDDVPLWDDEPQPEPEPYQLPARQELADRLTARIDEALARDTTPAPKPAPSPDRDEQTSREVASKNLARCVWTLAGFAATVDAAALMAKDWQPGQDIYPLPTTAERIRVAADYLYELAERWPQ